MNILCEVAGAVCSLHKLMSQQTQPSHKLHPYWLLVDQEKNFHNLFNIANVLRCLIWFHFHFQEIVTCQVSYIKKYLTLFKTNQMGVGKVKQEEKQPF